MKPKPPPKSVSSPPPRKPGTNGKQSPNPPAGLPSPPTSNYAAATPVSGSLPLRPHPAEADSIASPLNLGSASSADRQLEPAGHKPSGEHEADAQRLLGLTMQAAHEQIPEQVLRIRKSASTAQAILDDLAHMPLPGTDADDLSPGLAWPTAAGPRARRRAPAS